MGRPNKVMERTGLNRFGFDDGSGIGSRRDGQRGPAAHPQSLGRRA
jgi:hypothetical protein